MKQIVYLFTFFILSACTSIPVEKKGEIILVSPKATIWELIPQGDDIEKYRGEDILSEKTLRSIKDNNDALR